MTSILKQTLYIRRIFGASLTLSIIPIPAFAYLDPGTGSMILQLLVGAISGALIMGRSYLAIIAKKLGLVKKTIPIVQNNNLDAIAPKATDFDYIKKIANFFQSLRDAKRFFSTTADQRQLVFYSEGKIYLPFLQPVIEELNRSDCPPVSYLTSDSTDPLLLSPPSHVTSYFISDGLARIIVLNHMSASVVVMTMPDLNSFHIKRSPSVSCYAYIFHTIVSTHMIYRPGAFDHFDVILCAGPHHETEIRAYERAESLPSKRLLKHGYAPLDMIMQKRLDAEHLIKKKKVGPLHVLVAPSWGEYGLLETCGIDVVRPLLDAGYFVTVRPHPRTTALAGNILENLINTFSDNNRFIMDTNTTVADTMFSSDVMISDWSGIAFEYALGLEKPVLFVNGKPKINNPDYKNIAQEPVEISFRNRLGWVINVDELDQIAEACQELLNNRKSFSKEIKNIRSDLVYNLGNSAKAATTHLLDLVGDQAS